MLREISWEEFQKAGLLWWINRALHLFGYAIVCELEQDGTISRVYPARTSYRGFCEADETEGFQKLTEHLNASMPGLLGDIQKE